MHYTIVITFVRNDVIKLFVYSILSNDSLLLPQHFLNNWQNCGLKAKSFCISSLQNFSAFFSYNKIQEASNIIYIYTRMQWGAIISSLLNTRHSFDSFYDITYDGDSCIVQRARFNGTPTSASRLAVLCSCSNIFSRIIPTRLLQ